MAAVHSVNLGRPEVTGGVKIKLATYNICSGRGGMFYKAVVQSVLLYGRETWDVLGWPRASLRALF